MTTFRRVFLRWRHRCLATTSGARWPPINLMLDCARATGSRRRSVVDPVPVTWPGRHVAVPCVTYRRRKLARPETEVESIASACAFLCAALRWVPLEVGEWPKRIDFMYGCFGSIPCQNNKAITGWHSLNGDRCGHVCKAGNRTSCTYVILFEYYDDLMQPNGLKTCAD